MLTVAVIALFLLLLALLRIGLIIEYNDTGMVLWLKIGFIKKEINTTDKTTKRKKKPSSLSDYKIGGFDDFVEMLRILKKTLLRLKRKLLIKNLKLRYISAGSNPLSTAIGFGAANAIFGIIMPILERDFRISNTDISTSTDFSSDKPKFYAYIAISLAVWESVYVISALAGMFKTIERKDVEKNGKRTYKQSFGNNDAKNKGDDWC